MQVRFGLFDRHESWAAFKLIYKAQYSLTTFASHSDGYR